MLSVYFVYIYGHLLFIFLHFDLQSKNKLAEALCRGRYLRYNVLYIKSDVTIKGNL